MRPSEKGWLKDYLDFRKDLLVNITHTAAQKGSHPEHSLYRIIQPTGLMYGKSVSASLDHPDHEKWNEKDKMKILLAESLISSSLLFHDKSIQSPDDMS